MRKQRQIVTQDIENISETRIKAIAHKVNEKLDFIFGGKVKDIRGLQTVCIHEPTALAIRVWTDLERRYPGLRDLLLNSHE